MDASSSCATHRTKSAAALVELFKSQRQWIERERVQPNRTAVRGPLEKHSRRKRRHLGGVLQLEARFGIIEVVGLGECRDLRNGMSAHQGQLSNNISKFAVVQTTM